MNSISVVSEEEDPLDSHIEEYIISLVSYVLSHEHVVSSGCSIVLLPQYRIKTYNVQYRHSEYVPDVLSFPSDEDDYLGDVLICREQINIQSRDFNVDFNEEVSRVIIHGVLHLLGYVHTSYDMQDPMLAKQEILLSNFLGRDLNVQ